MPKRTYENSAHKVSNATDLEMLGEEVRLRVMDHIGVNLEWEIRRIGQWGADSLGMEK